MSAREPSLEFLLRRSVQMGPASAAAGASITKQNRSARRLGEVHARVLRALAAKDRYRHQGGSLTVDSEYRDALEEWHTVSCAALGLDDGSSRPALPGRTDEGDR